MYSRIINRTIALKTVVIIFLLFVSFFLRLIIYKHTTLFKFSDFSAYLDAIENIEKGEKQYLLVNTFLYANSYIGYFAKYILGSLHYYFIFNCLLGSVTSLILFILVKNLSGASKTGLIVIIILNFYNEFLIFSSVFYTPVIMLFLVSLFLLILYYYVCSSNFIYSSIFLILLVLIFILTFFFKQELKYIYVFLIVLALFNLKKDIYFSIKTFVFALFLLISLFVFNHLRIISRPYGDITSNDFIFFGHTDYGGDGGEGSFVYPANKARYDSAFSAYCLERGIMKPSVKERNRFQMLEVKKYITQHPLGWIGLQLKKFFRTFGVVPESTSFKILYTGLLKNKLWFTSFVVVLPVALIILLFIVFFDIQSIKQLFISDNTPGPLPTAKQLQINKSGFLYLYFTLFIYYFIATIFFGQYQERYRMPLMVLFIIPTLSYFISTFNKKRFLRKTTIIVKGAVIILFLTVWVFQAKKAIGNKKRLVNAIESIQEK